jgi:hypothetical protein
VVGGAASGVACGTSNGNKNSQGGDDGGPGGDGTTGGDGGLRPMITPSKSHDTIAPLKLPAKVTALIAYTIGIAKGWPEARSDERDARLWISAAGTAGTALGTALGSRPSELAPPALALRRARLPAARWRDRQPASVSRRCCALRRGR